jgi:hypothetical protein
VLFPVIHTKMGEAMSNLTPIEAWQLRRLLILADMLDAILSAYSRHSPESTGETIPAFRERLDEFRAYHSEASYGSMDSTAETAQGWLEKLEDLEADILTHIFSTLHAEAIEIIHAPCRNEGSKWGHNALEKKGGASKDARKALLVLNDYLVDGMPTDDNIEVVSSESRQITYNLSRCHYAKRFADAPMLAWILCSARQAWKDGFFGALGGVAHQLVTGKCMGDEKCMYVIALKDQ